VVKTQLNTADETSSYSLKHSSKHTPNADYMCLYRSAVCDWPSLKLSLCLIKCATLRSVETTHRPEKTHRFRSATHTHTHTHTPEGGERTSVKPKIIQTPDIISDISFLVCAGHYIVHLYARGEQNKVN